MVPVHHHEIAAGSRKGLHVRGHPQYVDAGIRATFSEPREASPVHGGVVLHNHQHGGHHRRVHLVLRGIQPGTKARAGTLGGIFPGRDQVFEAGHQGCAAGRTGGQVVTGKGAVPGAHVRQPLEPVPPFPGLGGGDGREDHFGGRVQPRELEHHAAGYVVDQSAGAGDAQRAGRPELGYHRYAFDVPELPDAVLDFAGVFHFGVVVGRFLQEHARRDGAQAEPQAQEAAVFGAVGPQQRTALIDGADGVADGGGLLQPDGTLHVLEFGDVLPEGGHGGTEMLELFLLLALGPHLLVHVVAHHEHWHHQDEHRRERVVAYGKNHRTHQQRDEQHDEGEGMVLRPFGACREDALRLVKPGNHPG
jgi:hypothetical protein